MLAKVGIFSIALLALQLETYTFYIKWQSIKKLFHGEAAITVTEKLYTNAENFLELTKEYAAMFCLLQYFLIQRKQLLQHSESKLPFVFIL